MTNIQKKDNDGHKKILINQTRCSDDHSVSIQVTTGTSTTVNGIHHKFVPYFAFNR